MTLFKTLILLGRPASGKSEFIDFMKKCPAGRRIEEFHVGSIEELDDFVWLWEKFTEDDLWEKAGQKRLFSKREGHGYVMTDASVLDYCLARFNVEFQKLPKAERQTVFVEFSRGKGDGGYARALNKLSDEVLKEAAVLFIYTSYEESYRRNIARYEDKLKHTVLAHKVPDEDMIRFGKEIDWLELTGNKPSGHLAIRNLKIPFVTMNNEPELKETGPLAFRYKEALDSLIQLYPREVL